MGLLPYFFGMQQSTVPIRAIAGRFSFDYSREVMERVFRQYPFEFCAQISSGVDPQFFSVIPAERQDWFISSEVRNCHYRGVDWNALEPIDEELLERMTQCEVLFLEIVSRLEWKRSIPYHVRKRWYVRHVRFWNDYLTRHRINVYLSAWVPHEIPDIVIYALCKLRNIPVAYIHTSYVRDCCFMERDWWESAVQIGRRYEELLRDHPDGDPLRIPLARQFEQRYQALVRKEGELPPIEEAAPLPLDVQFRHSLFQELFVKPFALLKYVALYLTPDGFMRALHALRRRRLRAQCRAFYRAHATVPDLAVPFIYLPLHFQPEASTVPLGGGYADQVLIAQMLHATLPEGVWIYVKEHPHESGTQKRNVDFYRDFLAIPRVRLIPTTFDTFTLREHCRAVATVTGTAGFEGLFRGKPVLLFGHCFFQYARGVHRIHSMEDCRRAVEEIFVQRKTPSLLECRLFLKAMEEMSIQGSTDPFCFQISHRSKEENVQACSDGIIRELHALFPALS